MFLPVKLVKTANEFCKQIVHINNESKKEINYLIIYVTCKML